ncbi:MAG: hypothetical protein N2F24_17425 [Deltaproteobacteria bacterium]
MDADNVSAYNNIGLVWHATGHLDRMCAAYAQACELGDCEKVTEARNNNLCP